MINPSTAEPGCGRWLARLCACALIVCAGVAPGYGQDDDAGRQLYEAYGCFQCHGFEGQGGVAGPRVAPSPYPYAAFATFVRRPANIMPAYSSAVLDDEDLQLIFEYVRTRPEPPAVDDIAALR